MRKLLAAVAVGCVLPLLTGGAANAAAITEVFQLTSDHCTGGCLTDQPGGVGGTVTVTDPDPGDGILLFTVELINGNKFINAGFDATFGFNLDGIGSVTYADITPSGFTIPNAVGDTQTAGSLHMDGTGFFQFGLDATGHGASNPIDGPLMFQISATDLTIGSLAKNSPEGQFFAVDIISGTTGNTGGIDASAGVICESCNPNIVTPEPASLALVGAALFGLAVARRRR